MISIRNISFSYANNEVLKNISFDLNPRDCVGILGNNGAGKSTLITCLNRIQTPRTGELLIDGKDALKMSRLELARRVSYVAQKNEISQMTVFDSVLLGRKPYIKWAMDQKDIDICDQMLERLGMTHFKLRPVNELSGGELQKIVLARALVQQPRLLLLDEPTSNLDPKNQYEVLSLVREIAEEREIGVLIVIHDISLALRYCNKFLFIKENEVYKYGGEETLTPETIREVYGIEATVQQINGRKVVLID